MSRALAFVCLTTVVSTSVADDQSAVNRILSALDRETALEFFESPLSEVVDYARGLHRIPIYVDSKALEDLGISSDTPITQNLKGVSFRSALNLMLRELELTYAIENEVLVITSIEAAAKRPRVAFYPIGDLATDEKTELQLLKIVRPFVTPRAQAANKGGEGSPDASIMSFRSNLIVTTTELEHHRVRVLLDRLRGTGSKKLANAPRKPVQPKSKSARKDPFGSGGQDPFGADPFGAGTTSEKSSDPASKKATDDPFGQ